MVPVSRPTLFFSADPIIFFNAIDRATLFSPGGCGLLIQRAKMASVDIDVGTVLKIAQQNNRQNHEKKFKKRIIPDLPTLIFSRYETGTTGIFLGLN
jgi:hypothetical protein